MSKPHKLEGHPSSAIHNCLFNIFSASPPYLEAIFSIYNPWTCHAMLTETRIRWEVSVYLQIIASLTCLWQNQCQYVHYFWCALNLILIFLILHTI